MIYFNCAASSFQRPPCVAEAVLRAMNGFGNASRGTAEAELDAARSVFRTRKELAELFGFDAPERVVFTANVTEALNMALFGLLNPGDRVVATDWDHNSVLRPLYQLELKGVQLDFIHADRSGNLILEEAQEKITEGTKLVVCTHASNLTGNLLHLKKMAELAHRHGALLLADAAQTAGTIPISMRDAGVDILCFTGHKGLMGPQGTGGLCVGRNVEIRPLVLGGTGVQSYLERQPDEYPTHLEAGTLNGHGIAGLGAAVRFILDTGVENIHHREMELMRGFLDRIQNIPGLRTYGNFHGDRAAIVALNIGDIPSSDAADFLMEKYGIATRAGAHCAPRMHRALGTDKTGAVRFSFGYFNTEEELDIVAEALRKLAETWNS